jgi:hypothetical protein
MGITQSEFKLLRLFLLKEITDCLVQVDLFVGVLDVEYLGLALSCCLLEKVF